MLDNYADAYVRHSAWILRLTIVAIFSRLDIHIKYLWRTNILAWKPRYIISEICYIRTKITIYLNLVLLKNYGWTITTGDTHKQKRNLTDCLNLWLLWNSIGLFLSSRTLWELWDAISALSAIGSRKTLFRRYKPLLFDDVGINKIPTNHTSAFYNMGWFDQKYLECPFSLSGDLFKHILSRSCV